jgi:hypothetical protein
LTLISYLENREDDDMVMDEDEDDGEVEEMARADMMESHMISTMIEEVLHSAAMLK